MRDFRSPEQPAGPPYQASGALVYFRNRSDEIEQCLRGLTNTSGPHFWLVVAPPQVGKTWFLHEIGSTLDLGKPVSCLASPARPWSVHLLDIGEVPAADRRDVGQLLRRIFGGAATGATDDDELRLIAQQIVRTGERCLRLLDGADLLAVDTSRALRRCLSRIHDIVIEADPQARLAVVVASRRDTEWRGLLDGYPPSVLQLTEFTSDVVLQALGDLAVAMRPDGFPDGVVRQNAERVHKLSEGLPALLVRCLQWIQENEWTSLERLESREVFTDLAEPYIRKDLLAPESLFPLTHGRPQPDTSGPPGAASEALEHAIRNLVTYRLFTQSHLQHHLGDPDLARCMADLNWQVEDLWREISGTALLARPLDEPWQQFPAAVRRLLFRFWYPGDDVQAEAHRAARTFMAGWAENQYGKEQIVGLVESLWHEAAIPRSRRWPEFETEICDLARRLSRSLRASPAYTIAEIRRYAEMRIAEDAELRQVVGNDGVLNRLVSIIVEPGPSHDHGRREALPRLHPPGGGRPDPARDRARVRGRQQPGRAAVRARRHRQDAPGARACRQVQR